jgi:ABC-type sugar transport system, periplasmic component
MKRRLLTTLLLTSMLAATLSGCSGNRTTDASATEGGTNSGSSSQEVAMTVAWWGNQIRNERTQKAIDMFEQENAGIKIDGQFSEWGDYWTKLSTSSAGNMLPDVVQMDYQYLEMYVANNLLEDLTPYIESGALDLSDVPESVINSGRVGDGIYAIPIGINAPSLFYNKKVVEEAGVTIKDNMTIDEFIEISKIIQEKTGYKTALPYGHGENWIEYLLRSEGIQYFDDGGKAFGVNSAEDFQRHFSLTLQGMEEGWHLPPEIFAETLVNSIEQTPLVYGSSPETMSWCTFAFSNQLAALQNAGGDDFEAGITTWPSDNAVLSNYLKPSQFFSVAADGKNIDSAIKFVDFWTNSVEANKILLGDRGVPASSVVSEGIVPELTNLEKMAITYINEVVTPNSSTINPPLPEKAGEIKNLLNSLEEQMCYGQITKEEAAQRLYDEGSKILAGN